jgi:hypothetical protein
MSIEKIAKIRKVETHPVISPSSENETRKIYAKKMCQIADVFSGKKSGDTREIPSVQS